MSQTIPSPPPDSHIPSGDPPHVPAHGDENPARATLAQRVRRLLSGRLVFDIAAGAALVALLAYAVSTDPAFRWPRRNRSQAPAIALTAAAALPPPGFVSVPELPILPQGRLRVSLLRAGDYAKSVDGEVVNALLPQVLARRGLPPGIYGAIFRYRGHPLPALVAEVRSGSRTTLAPPLRALAAIEYREGLEQAGTGPNPDVSYFRRVLRLQPNHVNAHLQLAAYELVRGSRYLAQWHLDAVRRADPGNADAARVQRLLRGR